MPDDASTPYKRRKSAKDRLSKLFRDPDKFNVIHYSCQSFYGEQVATSRRVTSISVLNVGSQQQTSFSIHMTAEHLRARPRRNAPALDPIHEHYDEIEKQLLTDFYEFVKDQLEAVWLHWNMRDTAYGFPAIEHRFRTLGGTPEPVPSSRLFNLADALTTFYGRGYIEHPHMYKLIERNGVTAKDLLSGQEESDAFDNYEYVKLHYSTLRKVQAIATLAELQQDGKLKTDAKFWARDGSTPAAFVDDITAATWFRSGSIVLWVVAIAGLIIALVKSIS
jgi:hypothetical protein